MTAIPFDLTRDAYLPGTTSVDASAGTGKTYAVEQILLLRILKGLPIERVLLLTFTRAAAEELAERSRHAIASRLREARECSATEACGLLERALLNFDSACITTIHAFCHQMLAEHSSQAGEWAIDDWTLDPDPSGSIQQAIDDAWVSLLDHDAGLRCFLPKGKRATKYKHACKEFTEMVKGAKRNRASGVEVAWRTAWQNAIDRLAGEKAFVPTLRELVPHVKAAQERALEALACALESVQVGSGENLDAARQSVSEALQNEGAEILSSKATMIEMVPNKSKKSRIASIACVGTIADRAEWGGWRTLLNATSDATASAQAGALDELCAAAMTRYLSRAKRLKRYQFHDLLVRMDGAVTKRKEFRCAVAARFDLVVVDEVQDTDPVQASVLRQLFAGAQRGNSPAFYLVGDPKQSIYCFRGADLTSYAQLRDLAGVQRRTLNKSYRSDPKLVDGVAHVFGVVDPFTVPGISLDGVESAFDQSRMLGAAGEELSGVRLLSDDDRNWVTLASAIADSLTQGITVDDGTPSDRRVGRPLRPQDIAVLCGTNRQVQDIHTALRRAGVTVVSFGRGSVLTSEMATEVARLLMAVAAPQQRQEALGACAGKLMGMTGAQAISEPGVWLERIGSASAAAAKVGAVTALRGLIEPRLADLARELDGDRHEADLLHILELITSAEQAGIRGAIALATWLATQMESDDGGSDSGAATRLVGATDAVRVLTLHKSKGLTFGVTWLPTFAMVKESTRDVDQESFAASRRTLYVGMTRSRWQTNVVWSPLCTSKDCPLNSLLEEHGGVDALVARSAGSVTRSALAVTATGKLPAQEPVALVAARPAPTLPRPMDMVSFSRLSAQAEHVELDVEGNDRDALSMIDRAPAGREWASECDRVIRAVGARGRVLGTAIHESLEDPQAFAALAAGGDRAVLALSLESRLTVGAKSVAAECTALANSLADVLALPIGATAWPTVADCAAKTRGTFRELRLATNWRGNASAIADAFALEPAPWAKAFVAEVQRLGAAVFDGLFIGTLDLVRCEGAEWFIYDYKSNDLGRAAEDYIALDHAMIASRYPLQAALYALALRQWIAARKGINSRGTDPIGGIAYLFVRGMDPAAPAQGVWTWRPSVALLDALTDLVAPQLEPPHS